MNYTTLGWRIRFFRKEKGLTQEQLAERAGLSASFVGHIERGSRIASLETVMRLCCALEITPNDLLAEETGEEFAVWPEQIILSPKDLLQNIALLLRMQQKPE